MGAMRKTVNNQVRSGDETLGVRPHLIIGMVLTAIAWWVAWGGLEPYSAYTFFPLWLGYILTVDGLTWLRARTSLLTRNARRFALLFVLSIPLWWLFEFANQFLGNWRYVDARSYGTGTYIVLASLAFSTVIPAIFVTAEYYRTFRFFSLPRRWIQVSPTRPRLIAIAAIGGAMFLGSLVFPTVMFPFVWIGLFLLLDVINVMTGGKSIFEHITQGRWNTVLILFAAGLTCGFFWEMWNYWSLPKWIYEVPYVSRPKLFEMPLLGYGGYLPFALEVYAAYHLLHTLLFRRRDTYLRFDETESDGMHRPLS